ncbi:uncharacterized protein BDR25DRAFT_271701 [Lindgomyces ingoldianus]|uniref:Uncharacterized protein n=1 Tax=Lindgomyces ingoldianus TaxID=673940 RepID=A0ACB6QCI9_9PLEO|nr:uncharacterized protein BDR25DRAFT_271701 [Lindgomyces ingoldianus]KAF2464658.1 hypothetical protein BDR25DRAFT_271701 [Lindgomyces ingoldianus]
MHPLVQAHANIKVLLITPPPVDEWQFDDSGEPGNPVRKAGVTRLYAEAVKEGVRIGKAGGMVAEVVDLWGAIMGEIGWVENEGKGVDLLPGDRRLESNVGLKMMLYDGLHLSGEGYRVLYREMKRVVGEAWPELRPERIKVVLEPVFPGWWE